MRKDFFKGIFFAALVLACSCSAKAQDGFSLEMTKAFADAGLPLLKERVAPQGFSLPRAVAPPLAAGEPISLAGLKGKVVFLNFWATWCGPCRVEMPSMEALYGRYREKGLEILAVNCGESADQVAAFMRNNRLSFPAVLDANGRVSAAYGIRAIPASFLIDRDGMIVSRVVGSLDWDTPKIHAALEQLLKP
jgi:thiol-disulfide isomerase/thioredoxin